MENGGRNAAATFFREPVCGEESSKEAFCFPIMKQPMLPSGLSTDIYALRIIQYKDGTHTDGYPQRNIPFFHPCCCRC